MDLKTSGELCLDVEKISELLNSYFVSVFSEEEGGDLLKSSFSFPGTPEEELGTATSLRFLVLLMHPGLGTGGCSGLQPRPATEPQQGHHAVSVTGAKNSQSNPSGHFSPAL